MDFFINKQKMIQSQVCYEKQEDRSGQYFSGRKGTEFYATLWYLCQENNISNHRKIDFGNHNILIFHFINITLQAEKLLLYFLRIDQLHGTGTTHAYFEKTFSSVSALLEDLDCERCAARRPRGAGAGAAAVSKRDYR
jgi:hypothetical protein